MKDPEHPLSVVQARALAPGAEELRGLEWTLNLGSPAMVRVAARMLLHVARQLNRDLRAMVADLQETATRTGKTFREVFEETVFRTMPEYALYRAARAVAEGRVHVEGDTLCLEISDEEVRGLKGLSPKATADERGLVFQAVDDREASRLQLASGLAGLLRLATLQAATGHRYLLLCGAPSKEDPDEPCGRVYIALPRGRPRSYCSGACRARVSRIRAKRKG